MADQNHKEAVAVFAPTYLSPSMTFIYNQIKGCEARFQPLVLTAKAAHLQEFPIEEIYLKTKGLLGRSFSSFVRLFGGSTVTLSPGQFFHWRKILKKQEVRLIHAHFGPAGIEILPLARHLRLPLLVTFHGYDASAYLGNPGYMTCLQKLFEYAHIICVSENMAQKLIAVGADPTRTIVHYIGIPVQKFRFHCRVPLAVKSRKGEEIVFLQVANFVEKKGHAFTLCAFRGFLARYPSAKLILAGEGPLLKAMKKLVQDLALVDRVDFPGRVPHQAVSSLMERADAFLHHSITAANGDMEGIPTVLMEAMASGLPVVTTCHSGIPELVTHGGSGFMVEEKDVAGYVRSLLSLLQDNGVLGANGRREVEMRFDLEKQNQVLAQIYGKVIKYGKC